jgi:hypothetical protein
VVASFISAGCSGMTDASSTAKTYTGQYSTQVVESTVSTSLLGGGTFPCTNTYTMSGTLTVAIDSVTGAAIGQAHVDGTQKETAHSSGDSCKAKGDLSTSWSPTLSGTMAALQFDDQNVVPNGGYIVTSRVFFSGALSGGVVTGVLEFSVNGSGTIGTTSIIQSYATTASVTLR